jgi:hypothetical protein
MRIFISYAREDEDLAEQINQALLGEDHDVFWDRTSLPSGQGYHSRIRTEVENCDLFVFLMSPESLADGSYSRTELKFAREQWPNPDGRVLPVLVRKLGGIKVPAYLGSATFLEPEGNIAAEVLDRVAEMVGGTQWKSGHSHTRPDKQWDNQGAVPVVTLGAPNTVHNVRVLSPQGSLPGMQIMTPVTVLRASGQSLQIVARFQVFGGPMLYANPMEMLYRDVTGLVATGTQRRPVNSKNESFTESSIYIPYYALNIPPTNFMMVHNLAVLVTAYLNERPAAQSTPTPFQLRW